MSKTVYEIQEVYEYNEPIGYVLAATNGSYRSQLYPPTHESLQLLRKSRDAQNGIKPERVYKRID